MFRFTRALLIATSVSLILTGCQGTGQRKITKPEELEKILKEAKGPDVPSLEEALLTSAKKADETRQYRTAVGFYKQLLEKNPNNSLYQYHLATSMRKAGMYEESIAEYNKLLDNPEHKVEALEGIALSLMAQGEYERAGDKLAEVMELDAARKGAINAIGILFTIKGMYHEARQYFEEALVVDPGNVFVLNNMALMEALDRRFDESLRLIREAKSKAGRTSPEAVQLDMNMALVYAIKGDLDGARAAAAPHLTEPQLLNNMGYYSYLAQDDNMAKSYLNMALTNSPVYYEKAWKNLESLNKLAERAPRSRRP